MIFAWLELLNALAPHFLNSHIRKRCFTVAIKIRLAYQKYFNKTYLARKKISFLL